MEVSFLCEWNTPALWHGANPRGMPEVRSASLKGLLRYWWRAWVGGLAKDSKELYQWEEAIFGSTQWASPLIVRAFPEPLNEKPKGTYQLTFSNKKGRMQHRLRFLAWDKGQKWRVEFKLREGYIPPDKRCIASSPCTPLWWGIGSFWLLQTFGGIGYRNRKGYGRFKAKLSGNPILEGDGGKKTRELLNLLWRDSSSSSSPCPNLIKLLQMAQEVINNCYPSDNRRFSSEKRNFLILTLQEVSSDCKELVKKRREELRKERFQKG